MTENSFFFKNDIPVSIGLVTYTVEDKLQKISRLTVQHGGEVKHPVDPQLTPWKVSAIITLAGSQSSNIQFFSKEINSSQAIFNAKLTVEMTGENIVPPHLNDDDTGNETNSILDQIDWIALPPPQSNLLASTEAIGHSLNFVQQLQAQSNWCWAAVTASIAKFYNAQAPVEQTQQCKLANWAMPSAQSSCCQAGSSPECNQPFSLEKALKHTKNLTSRSDGALSIMQIEAQINGNHPIGVGIKWQGGGSVGHALSLTGYDISSGTPYIQINDPYYGSSLVKLDDFPRHYKGGANWCFSYLTQAAA